jgi:hypothetical protein
MFTSSKYGVRIADLYFDELASPIDVDLVRYHYWTNPIAGTLISPYSTVVLDLAEAPTGLLAGGSNSTRCDVRRADRADGLSYVVHGSDGGAIDKFLVFFKMFAATKGTKQARRGPLLDLAEHKAVMLTSVCDNSGVELVWHVYLRVGVNARQLYSASLYINTSDVARRRFLARANKWHHWRDMLLLREDGASRLDLGGICEPCEDRYLMGIRTFKTGFGGSVVRMFDCTKAMTLRARAGLWAKDSLFGSMGSWRSRRGTPLESGTRAGTAV